MIHLILPQWFKTEVYYAQVVAPFKYDMHLQTDYEQSVPERA